MNSKAEQMKMSYGLLSSVDVGEVERGRSALAAMMDEADAGWALLDWLGMASERQELSFILTQLERRLDGADLGLEESQAYVSRLLGLLKLGGVEFTLRERLFEVMVGFLKPATISQRDGHFRQLQQDLRREADKMEFEPSDSSRWDNQGIQTATFVLRGLFDSIFDLAAGLRLHLDLSKKVIALYVNGISPLVTQLGSSEFSVNQMRSNQAVKARCVALLEIVLNYSELLKSYLHNFKRNVHNSRSKGLKHVEILHIFQEILTLTIGNVTQNRGLFSPTTDPQLNAPLLRTFSNIIPLVQPIQKYFISNPQEENSTYSSHFLSIIGAMINSLSLLISENKNQLDDLQDDDNLTNLISSSLKFIKMSSEFTYAYEYFSSNRKKIVFDVFLPLIVESSLAIEDLKDNPAQYAESTLEMCVFSSSKDTSIKNLLKKSFIDFSQNIDGFLSYVTNVSIQTIGFITEGCPLEKLETEYSLLKESEGSNFAQFTDQAQKIESSMLVLTILHEEIASRQDLLPQILSFFSKYTEKICQETTSELIKIRFMLFFFVYRNQINIPAQIESVAFVNKMYMWILQQIKVDDALSLIAVDIILQVVGKKKTSQFFNSKQAEIFVSISNFLPATQSSSFLKFVKKFVSLQKEFFLGNKDFLIAIVSLTVQKIGAELHSSSARAKGLVSGCLNILRGIVKKEKLATLFFDELDKLFGTFIPLLQAKDFDFEENIFDLFYFLMKKSGKMTAFAEPLLNVFSYSMTQNSRQIKFFPLFNLMLFKFRDFWTVEKLDKAFELLKTSLDMEANYESTSFGNSTAQGMLLLQVLIQCYPEQVKQRYIQSILELFTQFNTGSIDDPFHFEAIFDKIFGIIFSVAIYLPETTFAFLESHDLLAQILNRIFINMKEFFTVYEKKLLIQFLSLCIKYYIAKHNTGQVVEILNRLIPFIKFQELLSSKKFVQRDSKKKSKDNELIDSFELCYREIYDYLNLFDFNTFEKKEDEVEQPLEIEEIMNTHPQYIYEKPKLVKLLESPVLESDELQSFKDTIKQCFSSQGNGKEVIRGLLHELASKHFFSVLDRIQYVQFNIGPSSQAIREIVRIHKNHAQTA